MSKKTYFDYGKNNKPEKYEGFLSGSLSGSLMTMPGYYFDQKMLDEMLEHFKKIEPVKLNHFDPFTNVSLSGRAIMQNQEDGTRRITEFDPIFTNMGVQITRPEFHGIIGDHDRPKKFDLFTDNFFNMLDDVMSEDDVVEVRKVFINAKIKTIKKLKNG